jgi:hypothetical protein
LSADLCSPDRDDERIRDAALMARPSDSKKEQTYMKLTINTLVTILGACGIAMLAQPHCAAMCGSGAVIKSGASAHLRPKLDSIRLLPAAFQEGNDWNDHGKSDSTIVGFWHVTFTAKTSMGAAIPDTVIDDALSTWHDDGTETMNSGRPAQDGNFCLGVWKQTGHSSYKLNHFALGNQYVPGTPNGVVGDPAGPTQILESVRVDSDGKRFSGSFTLTATNTLGQPTQIFTGVITATRITLDTTVADLL